MECSASFCPFFHISVTVQKSTSMGTLATDVTERMVVKGGGIVCYVQSALQYRLLTAYHCNDVESLWFLCAIAALMTVYHCCVVINIPQINLGLPTPSVHWSNAANPHGQPRTGANAAFIATRLNVQLRHLNRNTIKDMSNFYVKPTHANGGAKSER